MKITKKTITDFRRDWNQVSLNSALIDYTWDVSASLDDDYKFKRYWNEDDFEQEVKDYGLKVALRDVQWKMAAEIFKEIGYKNITTS